MDDEKPVAASVEPVPKSQDSSHPDNIQSKHAEPNSDEEPIPLHRRLNDPHWTPGFLSQFPWYGFAALVMVVVCAVGSVLTLALSDNVSQSQWPAVVAPNVVLSIITSISSFCFGVAITNGIAIAWWRKTLKGCSIERLNRAWLFSSSWIDIALGVKYFNLIALAALVAKLTIIDATLFQNAFGEEIKPDKPVAANVTGYANLTIPSTGRVTGDNLKPGLLSKNFNDDLKIWAQGGGILPNTYAGCAGLCYLHVPGAGFEFDCGEPQITDINFGNQTVSAFDTLNGTSCADGNNSSEACQTITPTVFNLDFQSHFGNESVAYSFITMHIVYTNASDDGTNSCPGIRYNQTCTLRPAVINYPVQIEAYSHAQSTSSMSLGVDPKKVDNSSYGLYNSTIKQQNFFDVLRYNDIVETHLSAGDDTRTRIGGIAQGLSMFLGGNATITYRGVDSGFYVSQTGQAASYLWNDLGVQAGQRQSSQFCGLQYVNPMLPQLDVMNGTINIPHSQYNVPSLIGRINEIMFALALDISNEDTDKDVAGGTLSRPATMYKDTIHYVTDKGYMWGGFASVLVCVLLILPVYWGYWQLGRQVTLGPFEVAAAFRAPNLYHPANAPIEELITKIGDREVQYGQIISGDGAGRIGVSEPENVARIHPSAKMSHIKASWRSSTIGSSFYKKKKPSMPTT